MLFIGLDYHQRRSTFCVLDENGKKLISQEVKGTSSKVIEALLKVKKEYSQNMSICFEASCDSGYMHDALRKVAQRVVVAHPGQLRLIFKSKKKNDRVDARKLTHLLILDLVPVVYVPTINIRTWRQTIEYRTRLVNKRTRVKNEIRSLVRSHGIVAPSKLWTIKGLAWLSSLELPDELSAFKLSMLLDELASHKKNVQAAERVLYKEAQKHPGVQVLMSIPGVGIRTAECLVAYIDNPVRFSSKKKVASYFGLIPSLDSSAGKHRLGHITKQGPPGYAAHFRRAFYAHSLRAA